MSKWLLKEEMPFEDSLFVKGMTRARSEKDYKILLRKMVVLNNKRLLFSSKVIVFSIVVDGYPDMKSGTPFWAQELKFANIKDGAVLPIDPNLGFLIYSGNPMDFLNLYILAVRDMQATRNFANSLKNSFISKGIGYIAGSTISIFANQPPSVSIPVIRNLTTEAVNTTLDIFANRRDPVIGVYYGSLISDKNYSVGLHPPDYPDSLLNCGNALELSYEVMGG